MLRRIATKCHADITQRREDNIRFSKDISGSGFESPAYFTAGAGRPYACKFGRHSMKNAARLMATGALPKRSKRYILNYSAARR